MESPETHLRVQHDSCSLWMRAKQGRDLDGIFQIHEARKPVTLTRAVTILPHYEAVVVKPDHWSCFYTRAPPPEPDRVPTRDNPWLS